MYIGIECKGNGFRQSYVMFSVINTIDACTLLYCL